MRQLFLLLPRLCVICGCHQSCTTYSHLEAALNKNNLFQVNIVCHPNMHLHGKIGKTMVCHNVSVSNKDTIHQQLTAK